MVVGWGIFVRFLGPRAYRRIACVSISTEGRSNAHFGGFRGTRRVEVPLNEQSR